MRDTAIWWSAIPRRGIRDFDGDPPRVTEMDALVAYLQMLGTLVDVNTFDRQEERRWSTRPCAMTNSGTVFLRHLRLRRAVSFRRGSRCYRDAADIPLRDAANEPFREVPVTTDATGNRRCCRR